MKKTVRWVHEWLTNRTLYALRSRTRDTKTIGPTSHRMCRVSLPTAVFLNLVRGKFCYFSE